MSSTKPVSIHMIGHGHIDPTWLWRWTEGCEEVRATFRSALERMAETPGFKFTSSSACFYQWVKDSEPEMFARIRERVAEGRWEIVGGFWVEPDCNVPGGEAFVRHGLYSQRFFEREFGVRARVGFNPDSFGHAGTLPQILRKLGMDAYVYMRPSPGEEMDYPDGTTFLWEARDGSRVIASCILDTYVGDEQDIDARIKHLPQSKHLTPGQRAILAFYGVGNHGGGPTKRAIQAVLDAQARKTGAQVDFSTLGEYFAALRDGTVEEKLPVIRKDLQHHARGCYSAHAAMKQWNRQVEHALMRAERFATAAWLLDGRDYPQDALEKSWKDLLYNQFHDILAGTSLESSYEDTRDQLGAARHRADAITNLAIQSIARDVDTTPEGNTVFVINPMPWPVNQPVTVMPSIARTLEKPIHFVDDEEQLVPSQKVRHERVADHRYAFVAEVPAMGYRAFHARSGVRPIKLNKMLEAGPAYLENEWWRIEFDPYTGEMTRLFDKIHRVEVLEAGNTLAAMVDSSDTWSHLVRGYRFEAGRFGHARVAPVECGDVLATMQSTSTFGKSTAILEVTIYRDLDHIDIALRVNWQEQYHALKFGFATRVREGIAACDVPYGFEERPLRGEEEPCQHWVDLTGNIEGRPYGFAILNDGKFGFDALEGTLRMTVLRSPAYAHHDDARFNANEGHAIMDQGWHKCRFRLIPHAGAWQDARVVKQAWELNNPVMAHNESAHPGKRPRRATLLGTESGNVLIGVVKQSEDGKALVVRGYETAGRPAATTLHLPYFKKTFDLSFAPHEIKTVRIDVETWTMREVNLLEEGETPYDCKS